MGLLNLLPEQPLHKGWPWNEEVNANIYDEKIIWPKISIVSPSYNQGKYIEETIRSILLQNYPNLEYIIIDGGSTDDTFNIIKKYGSWITHWVSEKDGGQAEAINKGLKSVTGKVFNWINSDDYLAPNALKTIGEAFFKTDTDILAGVVNNFSHESYTNKGDSYYGLQTNSNLSLKNYFVNGGFYFHQPGVWLKKSLLDKVILNENSHYCFDTELLLDVLCDNPAVMYTDFVLVNFRLHESSKTTTQNPLFLAEFKQITAKYCLHPDAEIAAMANSYAARINWVNFLTRLQKDNGSKIKRVITLLKAIFKDPANRLNRFSLGCMRRIIIN
jgi:glycosyltransferase involved in cell wall biosynthesis